MATAAKQPMRVGSLRSIDADPNDSAARGAYADWLDEQPRPTKADAIMAGVQRRLCLLSFNACLSGFLDGLQTRRGRKHLTFSWDDEAPDGFIRITRRTTASPYK